MFFKPKVCAVCSPETIIAALQGAWDEDLPIFIDILHEGQQYSLGFTNDFEHRAAKDEATGRYGNPVFYCESQAFDTLEQFQSGALLGKERLMDVQDIGVILVNMEHPKCFPIFSDYVQ